MFFATHQVADFFVLSIGKISGIPVRIHFRGIDFPNVKLGSRGTLRDGNLSTLHFCLFGWVY